MPTLFRCGSMRYGRTPGGKPMPAAAPRGETIRFISLNSIAIRKIR
ncbi:hypothetical protein [Burkholderia anthina]|nr:hypothetical protein [Burkholderia anthina]